MTLGARVAAAIEILDLIIVAARDKGASADRIIADYFKARRYAGAKDRRAIREWVWAGVRRFGNRPDSGRAIMVALADDDADLAALFTGEGHAPTAIMPHEPRASGGPLPDWLMPYLARPEGGLDTNALLDRAPLDIRINTLKARREHVTGNWPEATPLSDAPNALRLPSGLSVETHPDYLDGHIEVQDYGSQLIALACMVKPDMTVLDLCAGAGGKTLALAADMGGKGRIIAADTSRARLGELPKRAARAGATIETRLLDGGREREALADLSGACDVVLIDAPCSGTGTWRRNPETRWRLNPARLDDLVNTQSLLLDIGADLVAIGGALVYAICSLTDAEGREQLDDFLRRNSRFAADLLPFSVGRDHGSGRLLTPCHDTSDGFFLARLKRIE